MADNPVETLLKVTLEDVSVDFCDVATYYGMTVGEYERLAGMFRAGVEEAIRAGRVLLMKVQERNEGGA